jgi:DNA repair exonuclease SbcCD ATPase subunit
MRILELEIKNVRGISDLLLKPEGRNILILGPNGSGKSSVVDAIDFLLTGRITRLTGKGTRGISFNAHGPHIDRALNDAVVRAKIQLPGDDEPVEIKRCMAKPDNIICETSKKPVIEPIMAMAQRGQHVLTRREILKYVTSDAKTRAQEIQELLDLTEIEDVRQSLVKAQNQTRNGFRVAEQSVDKAKSAVCATLQIPTYSTEVVLQSINQNRATLGGQPIATLNSNEIKKDLIPPIVVRGEQKVNLNLLEKDIQNLNAVTLKQNQINISETDKKLREIASKLRSDPRLIRALSLVKLTELGLELIDETGTCPLCDTKWPPGKLNEKLKQRLSDARVAIQYSKKIKGLSDAIAGSVNRTIESIQKVKGVVQILDLKNELHIIQNWLHDLKGLLEAINNEKYPDPLYSPEQVRRLLAPGNIGEVLTRIYAEAKAKYPEATPEQTAWDTLTRLQENLKALEIAQSELDTAKLFHKRASMLLDSYQTARDKILEKIYEDINGHFVDLYRQLHGTDEDGFAANIQPKGAGLNFEVDFYGRGKHPPHALHSEGQQDSMGLCLFLALSEQLTEGLIELIVLDDVVMSVDADHRRQICNLLASRFSNRQFLITTHDRTWAKQLRTENVVSRKGFIEFYNWKVDTGPRVNFEVDMWKRIKRDLDNNDVPGAAAKLRRGAEQFFELVCDALQVPVRYRMDRRYDLGTFFHAALGHYKYLLKKAKTAAESWGNTDQLEMLRELDTTRGQIHQRTNAEQWAVNASVHYNKWASFTRADFEPVVEAFQDLYDLFRCTSCGGMLRVVSNGAILTNVRCNCGQVNWNLIERK